MQWIPECGPFTTYVLQSYGVMRIYVTIGRLTSKHINDCNLFIYFSLNKFWDVTPMSILTTHTSGHYSDMSKIGVVNWSVGYYTKVILYINCKPGIEICKLSPNITSLKKSKHANRDKYIF